MTTFMTMNAQMIKWLTAVVAAFVMLTGYAQAADAIKADRFVKNFTEDILASIKANKQALLADPKKMNELVDTKVLPFVNFKKMTAQVAGVSWRSASDEQRGRLTDEFKTLLVRTYSGALAQVKDQQIQIKPLRVGSDETDVVVQSVVTRPKGEPLQLDYRVEKVGDDWKIYDVNVAGLWLVETYRTQFSAEINKGGLDGLIKSLSDKNKMN